MNDETTRTSADATLFSGTESGWSPRTPAVLRRAPALSIRVRATMRTEPPGGMVPRAHVVLPHVPWETFSETKVAAAAAWSVIVTPVAVSGPLLVTTTVQVTITAEGDDAAVDELLHGEVGGSRRRRLRRLRRVGRVRAGRGRAGRRRERRHGRPGPARVRDRAHDLLSRSHVDDELRAAPVLGQDGAAAAVGLGRRS